MDIDPVIVLARFFYYGATSVLFGSSLFSLYAAGIGQGDTRFWLPRDAAATLATMALLSALIWLAAFTISIGNLDGFIATLQTILFGSSLGTAWILRLFFLALLFLAVLSQHPLLVATAAFAALFSEGWSGHGASAGWLGPMLHAVHAVCAAAWVGGLVALARVIAAARTGTMERRVAEAILGRFSRIGLIVVLLLATTGSAMAWLMIGGMPQLSTGYGRLLLLKVALFAAMAGLAAINRLFLVPKVASHHSGGALNAMSATILLEQLAGAAVLFDVAVLGLMDLHAR
jgi:copper resistance protein D